LTDLLPERLLRQAAMFIQHGGQVAEEAVEHIGKQRQQLHFFRHLDGQPGHRRRQGGIRVQDGGFFGNVLHDGALRDIVFQLQDEVFPMRHEHQLVGIEAVQQRCQIGLQIARHPVARIQAGAVDQRSQQGGAVGIDMQQRRHGHQPFSRPSKDAGLSRHSADNIFLYGESLLMPLSK
jgi:hypothetical protein